MRTFFTFLLAIAPLAVVQAAPSTLERACGPPDINAAAANLIQQFEGFVAIPAPDPIGLPTIGYGHLCKSKDCAEVPFKLPLSQDNAVELLQSDLETFKTSVSKGLKPTIELNDNQYRALTSWAFNVGCGNVGEPNLVNRANAGGEKQPHPIAVVQLERPQWKKGGKNPKKVSPGLMRGDSLI